MKFYVLVFLICAVYRAESLKILFCYPIFARSLNMLGQSAIRHLINAGHEVTYITVFPMKNPLAKNYREIDISSNAELIANDETFTLGYVLEHEIKKSSVLQFQEFSKENARLTFENENVKKFLQNRNEHFDIVVADLYESEVYAGLAVLYNCPLIWLYSMGAHWQVLRLIDEGKNPAYDPDYFSTNSPPFTFAERFDELWTRIKWQVLKTFVTLPGERQIYEKTFGPLLTERGRTLPDYEKVIYNSSLIFSNEHNAVKYRPSTPQNFKYVGGFHIEDPPKPLPKNLQDLINSSKHGVIYFSMGSFLQSNSLPKKLVAELLQTFGELKQTVIWKFETDLPNVPKNVHIVHWAPQQSILAHPNVRMFISHGGQLSSIEAVHFGVPIIGVPVFFDQFTNINKAVKSEYALRVPLSHDLPKNLKVAIHKMLTNDSYANKVKELSAIYHDRQTKPGDDIVHWVEHVVRTRGAPHLRSPALHVPLYQLLYLDLLIVIVGITAVIYLAAKSISTMLKSSKKNGKKKRN